MPASAFLYRNLIDAAPVAVQNATAPGMPASRLVDPQPRHRARWVAPTTAFVSFDLGQPQQLGAFALVSTNLTAASVARFRCSLVDGLGTEVYLSPNVAGLTAPEWNGAVVHVPPAPVTARYVGFRIDDPTLAWIDVGRFVAGPLWRTAKAWQYGAQLGRLDLSVREQNPTTGAEFGRAGPRPRAMLFTLPALTAAEAEGDLEAMDRTVGAAGDVLWIPDVTRTAAALAQTAIWGSFRPVGESLATRANFVQLGRAFRLVERL